MQHAHTSHLTVSPTDIERCRDRDQDEYSLLELGQKDYAMWEMRVTSALQQHFIFNTVFILDLNMSNLSHGFNS